MDLHEVHRGAVNSGYSSYSVTQFHGKNFIVYSSGSDVIITDQSLHRVQTITRAELVTNGYVTSSHGHVTAISCDLSGKIAVSYGQNVVIIEPRMFITSDRDLSTSSSAQRTFIWKAVDAFQTSSSTTTLCFNTTGTRIVTAGTTSIQLWISSDPHGEEEVDQLICDPRLKSGTPGAHDDWSCVWEVGSVSPVLLVAFSPDDQYVATLGKDETFVKVWFERRISERDESADIYKQRDSVRLVCDHVLLRHPKHCTGFEWRKASKYINRGAVCNALITWCEDSICRVWCETLALPGDEIRIMNNNNNTMNNCDSYCNIYREYESDHVSDLNVKDWPVGSHVGGGMLFAKSKNVWARAQNNGSGEVKQGSWKSQSYEANMTQIDEMIQKRSTMNKENSVSIEEEKKNMINTSNGIKSKSNDLDTADKKQNDLKTTLRIKTASHFHLSTSFNVNAELPGHVTSYSAANNKKTPITVHWLNNKKLEFSNQVEKFLEQLHSIPLQLNGTSVPSDQSGTSTFRSQKKSEDGVKRRSALWRLKNQSFLMGSNSTPGKLPRRIHSMWRAKSELFRKTMEIVKNEDSNLTDFVRGLLKTWKETSDVLFAFHPLTGKLLLWYLEHMESNSRGILRQTTVTPVVIPHSLAIPSRYASSLVQLMFPICDLKLDWEKSRKHSDESSHSPDVTDNVTLKENTVKDLKRHSLDGSGFHLSKKSNGLFNDGPPTPSSPVEQQNVFSSPESDKEKDIKTDSAATNKQEITSPTVSMITLHDNGSLVMWNVTFTESNKFSDIDCIECKGKSVFALISMPPEKLLLIGSKNAMKIFHFYCTCILFNCCQVPLEIIMVFTAQNYVIVIGGHRFKIDRMISHPTLSLVLTTGHSAGKGSSNKGSELIVWATRSVGPVSGKEALSEVARISSPSLNAYKHVTWLPINQQSVAVEEFAVLAVCDESLISVYKVNLQDHSQSRTAGAPIVLIQTIKEDCLQMRSEVLLLNTFVPIMLPQSCSDTLLKNESMDRNLSTKQNSDVIHLAAMLISREQKVTIHCWKLKFESAQSLNKATSHISGAVTKDESKVRIKVSKVCAQVLPIDSESRILSAGVTSNHLASSPSALLGPPLYQLATAHSGGIVRFWSCRMVPPSQSVGWVEWCEGSYEVGGSNKPRLKVEGEIVRISNFCCGLLAVAFRTANMSPQSVTRVASVPSVKNQHHDSKLSLTDSNQEYGFISIYECISTGGLEWICQGQSPLGLLTTDLWTSTLRKARSRLESFSSNSSGALSFTASNHQNNVHKTKANWFLNADESDDEDDDDDDSDDVTDISDELYPTAPLSVAWMCDGTSSHLLTVAFEQDLFIYTINKASHWTVIRRLHISNGVTLNNNNLSSTHNQITWSNTGELLVSCDAQLRVYSQWSQRCTCVAPSQKQPERASNTSTASMSRLYQSNNQQCKYKKDLKRNFDDIKKSATVSDFSHADVHNSQIIKCAHCSTGRLDLTRHKSVTALAQTANSVKLLGDKRGRVKRERIGTETEMNREILEQELESGLFEEVKKINLPLPQYHPKQLLELFLLGKHNRVKAILIHLLHCIEADELVSSEITAKRRVSVDRQENLRQRRMSVWGPAGPKEAQEHAEEDRSEGPALANVPPLPLYAVLAADEGGLVAAFQTGSEVKNSNAVYSSLFNDNTEFNQDYDDDDLDDDDDDHDDEDDDDMMSSCGRSHRRRSHADRSTNKNEFGPVQASSLARYLVQVRLPRLTGLEQMHLMALADTVANGGIWNIESITGRRKSVDETVKSVGVVKQGADILDDCGRRFLMSQWRYVYLLNTVSYKDRYILQQTGLSSSQFVWAFHSNSQQNLLESIYDMKTNPTWVELRQFGVGWWLRDPAAIRDCVEKLAKTEYLIRNDAMDVILYYIALKKIPVLAGLFKLAENNRMMEFFKKNFNDNKSKIAAKKNAFQLMSKHRYEHAAAFFLLSGSLKDCLQVCMNNLKDVQLALMISRLMEPDERCAPCRAELLRSIVEQRAPVGADDVMDYKDRLGTDPFLRSMVLWLLKDYSAARVTLLQPFNHQQNQENDLHISPEDALIVEGGSVFNLYSYLFTHPLLIMQQSQAKRATSSETSSVNFGNSTRLDLFDGSSSNAASTSGYNSVLNAVRAMEFSDSQVGFNWKQNYAKLSCSDDALIARLERRMYFSTAYSYLHSGYPMLALEVLQNLPKNTLESSIQQDGKDQKETEKKREKEIDNSSKPIEKVSDFDWAAPSFSNMEDEAPSFKIDDDDDNDDDVTDKEDDDDDDEKRDTVSEMKTKHDFNHNIENSKNKNHDNKTETEKEMDSGNESTTSKDSSAPSLDDALANQLKLSACWAILREELVSLSTGFDVRGGQLRYHLCVWLEKVVDVLKVFCNYEAGDEVEIIEHVEGKDAWTSPTVTIKDHHQGARRLSVVNVNPILAPDALLFRRSSISDGLALASTTSLRPDLPIRRKSHAFLEPVPEGLRASPRARHISDLPDHITTAEALTHEEDALTLRSFSASDNNLVVKMGMLSKRAEWVKQHGPLLNALMSSVILQDSGFDSDLSSIQLELSFLLQEISRKKFSADLEKMLPLPTELPLLISCLSGRSHSHTDPVSLLEDQMLDILDYIIRIKAAPGMQTDVATVYRLRDLSVSLSRCLYQSLSATDDDVTMSRMRSVGMEGFSVPVGRQDNNRLINGQKQMSIKRQSMAVLHDLQRFRDREEYRMSYWKGISNLQTFLLESTEIEDLRGAGGLKRLNSRFRDSSYSLFGSPSPTVTKPPLLSVDPPPNTANSRLEPPEISVSTSTVKTNLKKFHVTNLNGSTGADVTTVKHLVDLVNSGANESVKKSTSQASSKPSVKISPPCDDKKKDVITESDLIALVNSCNITPKASAGNLQNKVTSTSADNKYNSPDNKNKLNVVEISITDATHTANTDNTAADTLHDDQYELDTTALEAAENLEVIPHLLISSALSTYCGLVSEALALYDARALYRLVGNPPSASVWPILFGDFTWEDSRAHLTVQSTVSGSVFDGNACRGVYMPPTLNMLNFFMTKPVDDDDYDSDDDDNDDDDAGDHVFHHSDNTEHVNPDSFSWTLMRVGIVKFVIEKIETLLKQLDVDTKALTTRYHPVKCLLDTLGRWSSELSHRLQDQLCVAPPDFIDLLETAVTDIKPLKYSDKREILLDTCNTPFSDERTSSPARRLWLYLLEHEVVQKIFIEQIFRHVKEKEENVAVEGEVVLRKSLSTDKTVSDEKDESETNTILFRAHDPIWAFSINQTNTDQIVVTTNNEMYEICSREYTQKSLNIKSHKPSIKENKHGTLKSKRVVSHIDKPQHGLSDTKQTKRKGLSRIRSIPASFSPFHPHKSHKNSYDISDQPSSPPPSAKSNEQELDAINITSGILTRPGLVGFQMKNIRKLVSHPESAIYLSGSSEGEVSMWYYGNTKPECSISCPATKPLKINALRFNNYGNKFGIGYDDGLLSLWTTSRVLYSSQPSTMLQCYGKSLVDFTFVKNRSSLLCTAGVPGPNDYHNYNVCLWDTLLPSSESLVQGFSCHPDGIVGLYHLETRPLVITAGRNGEVQLTDMRNSGQPVLSCHAHTSQIKCLTVDHQEKTLITGSQDGNIKVWNLLNSKPVCAWTGAHIRSTPALRNPLSGINQLHVDTSGSIYSCGCDGRLKLHKLPSI